MKTFMISVRLIGYACAFCIGISITHHNWFALVGYAVASIACVYITRRV
jgi:predicted Kef-type K+ transport protein